jgi:hypothetical protein
MMPVEYVRRQLERQCTALGSQKRFSAIHKVSIPYVNDVLNGRREPGKKILKALKMKRVIGYVYVHILLATILLTLPTWSHAAEVTLDYGQFKNMVQQCHSCRKAVAAYKEKDIAQAAVIESQKGYIETLEEGQRIQGALNTAYEAKLREGEQLSWYERGAWFAAGVGVALVTKRIVPMWRVLK